MDALSDVISTVRFSSSAFLNAELTAPWCIEAQITPDDCRPFGPVPAQLVAYHFVVAGEMSVHVAPDKPFRAAAGDIILLPRNDRHILGSAPDLRPARIDHLIEESDSTLPATLKMGGGGDACHIICGFLGGETPSNPLIDSLPNTLRFSTKANSSGSWPGYAFQKAAEEFARGGIGSATILSKLAELLFIEAIREYLVNLPADNTGWLAGLRDLRIGKALAAMHRQPARNWTTDDLAATADLSRSAFAERFTQLVGMPPMRYLARWRLQLAAVRLRESVLSIGQIAYQVGYESEPAFNRAFRKAFSCTPGKWRQER